MRFFMKKILHFSYRDLSNYGSVRSILFNMVSHPSLTKYNHVFAVEPEKLLQAFTVSNIYNFKTYSLQPYSCKNLKIYQKLALCFKKLFLTFLRVLRLGKLYVKYEYSTYFKKIIKEERPDIVVFSVFAPSKIFTKILIKHKIPYCCVLFDTFIENPAINKKKGKKIEEFVINNSIEYFIPSYFYNGYKDNYQSKKIKSYYMPLLIDSTSVKNAYANCELKYSFSYFGSMHTFRNSDVVKKIFKQLNLQLHIFNATNKPSDEVFIQHKPLHAELLYEALVSSKFLVVFDNGHPYEHYLPSKVIPYVSFTKPIIVFGNNNESALKNFLKDYPLYYYHDIREPLDGLIEFINKDLPNEYNEEIYSNYLKYLPENALKDIAESIKNVLDN